MNEEIYLISLKAIITPRICVKAESRTKAEDKAVEILKKALSMITQAPDGGLVNFVTTRELGDSPSSIN